MCFDGCLGFAEMCPGEDRKAQIDGGGIECEHRLVEIQGKRLVSIEIACATDEMETEVLVNQEIPFAIGIGKCRTRDLAAKTNAIEFLSMRMKTSFDIAQSIAPGELGKCRRLYAKNREGDFK